jgi:hypothetical protein
MINSVTVTNYIGESVTMELRFPERSGFLVRGITGLTPSKADIGMTNLVGTDGAIFNSSRTNFRNIVLNLVYKPSGQSIEELRHRAYRYFPIKKPLSILIETDARVCETYGYVESHEIDIFNYQEGSDISIICPDSYLYGIRDQVTNFSGVSPEFQFPFENPSTSQKLIEMGNLLPMPQRDVYYLGEASIGMLITVHVVGAVEDFSIVNTGSREEMSIVKERLYALLGGYLQAGDDVTISTIYGDKYVHLVRDGVTYNILNALDPLSDWFVLEKGDNVFACSTSTPLQIENLRITFTNRLAYEGI